MVIGVDPGLTGALSYFVNGRLTDVKDIPVNVTDKASKGATIRDLIGGKSSHKHRELDKAGLADIFRKWVNNHSARIIREDVHTMPRQSIRNNGRLMEVVGAIDGIAATLGIPIVKVPPQTWQKATGTPPTEKGTCQRAAEVFPEWSDAFKRTSIDHNRADAVMIGCYGVIHASQD